MLSLLKKQGEQQQQINQLLETDEKIVARRTDGAKPGHPWHAIDAHGPAYDSGLPTAQAAESKNTKQSGHSQYPRCYQGRGTAPGFLKEASTQSLVVGVDEVGGCPEEPIVVMGLEARCLLNTGAHVPSLTEFYYRQYLESNVKWVDISNIMRVNSSQGLDMWNWMPTSWEEYFLDLGF